MEEKQANLEILKQAEAANKPLKNAIDVCHTNANAQNVTNVLSQIVNSHLLVPAVVKRQIPANTGSLDFAIAKNKDVPYLLAFTDLDELTAWSKDYANKEDYIVVDFGHLVSFVQQNSTVGGYLINCKGKHFILERRILIQMLERLQKNMRA